MFIWRTNIILDLMKNQLQQRAAHIGFNKLKIYCFSYHLIRYLVKIIMKHWGKVKKISLLFLKNLLNLNNDLINYLFIILFSEPWALFRLSYLWYTLTGALVTITVSLVVSIISSEKIEKLDPKLVAPFIRKYLRSTKTTELCQVQVMDIYFFKYT